MSLAPRVPQEVTALPPSSVVVFVSSNSPVLSHVFIFCILMCVRVRESVSVSEFEINFKPYILCIKKQKKRHCVVQDTNVKLSQV